MKKKCVRNIYWDFHLQAYLGFSENGLEKDRIFNEGQFFKQNVLLMPEYNIN